MPVANSGIGLSEGERDSDPNLCRGRKIFVADYEESSYGICEMKELLPIQELESRFPEAQIRIMGFDELKGIIDEEPTKVYNIAINVWNRIVQRNLRNVDPQAVAEWVDRTDPFMHEEISRLIDAPVIHDIVFMKATVPTAGDPEFVIAEYMAAEVFPDDLHLADIMFRDPAKPLPRSAQRNADHRYQGLGLLPVVMQKADALASKRRKNYITMTAATADLVPLFESYGYRLEQNEIAKLFYRTGYTIPMEKKPPKKARAG